MATLVERAQNFAIYAHHGQTRADGITPYWRHLEAVALRVERFQDDVLTAAAWCHDVLEDTRTGWAQLAERTSKEVADLVVEVTDVYTKEAFPALPRERRKRLEALRYLTVTSRARLLKRADIADNDRTIHEKGGGFAKLWREEKDYLLRCIDVASHVDTILASHNLRGLEND